MFKAKEAFWKLLSLLRKKDIIMKFAFETSSYNELKYDSFIASYDKKTHYVIMFQK